jgi:hypothetical protein
MLQPGSGRPFFIGFFSSLGSTLFLRSKGLDLLLLPNPALTITIIFLHLRFISSYCIAIAGLWIFFLSLSPLLLIPGYYLGMTSGNEASVHGHGVGLNPFLRK